jgi:hypothetical protein
MVQPPQELHINVGKAPPKVHLMKPRLHLHRPRNPLTQPPTVHLTSVHDKQDIFSNNHLLPKDVIVRPHPIVQLHLHPPLAVRKILGNKLPLLVPTPIVHKHSFGLHNLA